MQIVTFQGFPCQTVSPTLSTGEKEQLWTEDVKRSKGRILLIFQDISKKILIIIGKKELLCSSILPRPSLYHNEILSVTWIFK